MGGAETNKEIAERIAADFRRHGVKPTLLAALGAVGDAGARDSDALAIAGCVLELTASAGTVDHGRQMRAL